MSTRLPITNDYPPDWPAINAKACEEAGYRCIRCGHPYRKGAHGSGQWSPCDIRCTHEGPLGYSPDGGPVMPMRFSPKCAGHLVTSGRFVFAEWRILTVHHMDGDKANCEWFNLLPLCQRCHLQIQGKVNPEIPYFLEHSAWAKPYVAGFYAKKYESKILTRAEVMVRLDELLAYERLA